MNREIRDTGRVPTFFSQQVREADRFYLDASGDAGRSLAVVCGGWERCGTDYRIDRTDFPFYSIEFVARGRGTLTLKGRTLSLHPGSVFSYGPGIAHVIVSEAAEPLVKYFIDFTGPTAARILGRYELSPGTAVRVASPEVILRIFDDLIANGSSGTRHAPAICATLVQLLILKVAEGGRIEDSCHMAAFSTYQNCRRFIQEHFATVRTLEEVAEACHVDKAYLCRLFKRFDSQSPYQYLTQLKMARAAQCLHRSEKLVKEIAFELGFHDAFHFSRAAQCLHRSEKLVKEIAFELGFHDAFHFSLAFKKAFGLSPDALRRLR